MPLVGVARLKDDVTLDYNGTPIAILKDTQVTLLKKAHKGFTAEILANKDNTVVRIVFNVFKKELTELQIHEKYKSGTLSESVDGEVSVQE